LAHNTTVAIMLAREFCSELNIFCAWSNEVVLFVCLFVCLCVYCLYHQNIICTIKVVCYLHQEGLNKLTILFWQSYRYNIMEHQNVPYYLATSMWIEIEMPTIKQNNRPCHHLVNPYSRPFWSLIYATQTTLESLCYSIDKHQQCNAALQPVVQRGTSCKKSYSCLPGS